MIEEKLEKFRKIYIKIRPPEYLITHGWADLKTRLDPQREVKRSSFNLFTKGLMFASLVLVFLGGFLGLAQKSQPGQALYPVKVLSDKIGSVVIKNFITPIENTVSKNPKLENVHLNPSLPSSFLATPSASKATSTQSNPVSTPLPTHSPNPKNSPNNNSSQPNTNQGDVKGESTDNHSENNPGNNSENNQGKNKDQNGNDNSNKQKDNSNKGTSKGNNKD